MYPALSGATTPYKRTQFSALHKSTIDFTCDHCDGSIQAHVSPELARLPDVGMPQQKPQHRRRQSADPRLDRSLVFRRTAILTDRLASLPRASSICILLA